MLALILRKSCLTNITSSCTTAAQGGPAVESRSLWATLAAPAPGRRRNTPHMHADDARQARPAKYLLGG